MALENFIGTLSNVPSDYGIPVPTGIKKFIENIINLPKSTDSSSRYYGYFTKFKIISDMYYVTKVGEYETEYDKIVDNASVGNRFIFIDPNSVFILPNKRSNIFSYNYKIAAFNGSPQVSVSELGQNDYANPFIYAFPAETGGYRGGAISVNVNDDENIVEVLSDGVDVVCKVSFTYFDSNSNASYTGTSNISLLSSLGLHKGFSTTYSDYVNHVTNLGFSEKLENYVYRQNNIFASYESVSYGNRGFIFTLTDVMLVDSEFSLARRWLNSTNVSTDLFFLLFPKVVFADTSSRIDTLLNMTAEDFKKEIKYDIGADPYAPVNPSAPSGGNGNYGSGESYFQSAALIPNGSAETDDSATGLYTRYAVSIPILQSVGDWLWAESLGLQVAKTLVSLLYGDPIQTIISCVSYPFGLNSVGLTGTTLKWGGHDTGVSIDCLTKSSYQIDWGTITVSEYWGNFLDYSPHTKMQLFLPWGTGFVDIDPNDVMRAKPTAGTDSSTPIEVGADGTGTISVITNIEFSRGICVHHVVANRIGGYGGTIIGTYSGSCGRQIPITGSDYASKQVAVAGSAIAAMVTGALAGGSAIKDREQLTVTKNPNGMFKGHSAEKRTTKVDAKGKHHDPTTGKYTKAPYPEQRYDVKRGEINTDRIKNIVAKGSKPAIASAASVLVSPPHVTRSGSFQEGSGGLTPQAPYLLISRPRVNIPSEYGSHYGYPSNITFNLEFLRGYTEIAEIHLDSIPATIEEIFELEDLLKGGVIL